MTTRRIAIAQRICGAVVVMIGTGLIVFAIIMIARQIHSLSQMNAVPGLVTNSRFHPPSLTTRIPDIRFYQVSLDYRTARGQSIAATSSHLALYPIPSGTRLTVYYDPKRPSAPEINAFETLWAPWTILIAAGTGIAWLGKRMRRTRRGDPYGRRALLRQTRLYDEG